MYYTLYGGERKTSVCIFGFEGTVCSSMALDGPCTFDSLGFLNLTVCVCKGGISQSLCDHVCWVERERKTARMVKDKRRLSAVCEVTWSFFSNRDGDKEI